MNIATADLINAAFEFTSFIALFNHCRVLVKDKEVKGVSIASTLFFTTWGYWNLYYYDLLGQTWSFYGCVATVTANTIWVYLMILYGIVKPWRRKNAGRIHADREGGDALAARRRIGDA